MIFDDPIIKKKDFEIQLKKERIKTLEEEVSMLEIDMVTKEKKRERRTAENSWAVKLDELFEEKDSLEKLRRERQQILKKLSGCSEPEDSIKTVSFLSEVELSY